VENGQLKRKALTKDTDGSTDDPDFYEQVLADGIEVFHIMWGIDSDGNDGAVDYFTSSPSAAELDEAVTAKIYVLARGSQEILGYTNEKSFVLGDLNIAAANDGFYRRVFSTTAVLRNSEAVQQYN
jgi:hypothetical protein